MKKVSRVFLNLFVFLLSLIGSACAENIRPGISYAPLAFFEIEDEARRMKLSAEEQRPFQSYLKTKDGHRIKTRIIRRSGPYVIVDFDHGRSCLFCVNQIRYTIGFMPQDTIEDCSLPDDPGVVYPPVLVDLASDQAQRAVGFSKVKESVVMGIADEYSIRFSDGVEARIFPDEINNAGVFEDGDRAFFTRNIRRDVSHVD